MSCLFNSLCRSTGMSPFELRQKICDYQDVNPIFGEQFTFQDIIQHEDINRTIKDYTQSMRKESTMGGAIEIACFCNLFSRKVIVKILQTGDQVEFSPLSGVIKDNPIYLQWNGGHFDEVIN